MSDPTKGTNDLADELRVILKKTFNFDQELEDYGIINIFFDF